MEAGGEGWCFEKLTQPTRAMPRSPQPGAAAARPTGGRARDVEAERRKLDQMAVTVDGNRVDFGWKGTTIYVARFKSAAAAQAFALLLENNPFLRFLLAAFRFVVCVCDPDPTTLPTTRGDAFLKMRRTGSSSAPTRRWTCSATFL